MSFKTIMFAGFGLLISMTATAMYMKNDIARMKADVKAKESAACTTPAADTSTAPVDEFGAPVATPETSPAPTSDCAPAGTTDGATGNEVEYDAATDPYAANAPEPMSEPTATPDAGGASEYDPATSSEPAAAGSATTSGL